MFVNIVRTEYVAPSKVSASRLFRHRLMKLHAVIGLSFVCLVWGGGGLVHAEREAWSRQYKLDWLNLADVNAVPYLTDSELRSLADGDPKTGARGASGPEIGGTVEFHFGDAIHVTEVRFVLEGASVLEINAGGESADKFDKQIAKLNFPEQPNQQEEWITVPVKQSIRSLRFVALDGQPPYRRSYPQYYEIEIYTDKKVASPPSPKPETARSQIALGPQLPLPASGPKKIEITPCIDLWMAGMVYGREDLKNFEQSPGFQRLLRQLQEIDATGVRIFPETYNSQNTLPWKSKIGPHLDNEPMKVLIDALHKHGLKSYIFMHAWIAPLQKKDQRAPMPYCRWDYPYEQSDFIFTKGLEDKYKVRYPCIISDDHFQSNWLALLSEVVDRGIDGVYVLPDEYYYKGHYLPKTDCPDCTNRFKADFGYDNLPGKAADNEHYRKWKTFEYTRLAKMFNEIAGKLKEKKPDLELLCCPNLYFPSNTRMEHGVAADIMGAQENFTGVQVYSGDPKRAEAAFPDKVRFGSIQTLGTSGATDFPIIFQDYFMELLMNGCTKINMYRLNYMEPYWQTVTKTCKMARLLEQWGLCESKSAAETCVIISRASEDWWQVSADTKILDYINSKDSNLLFMDPKDLAVVWSKTRKTFTPDARVRHYQYERFRGMYSNQYIEQLLKPNGIQYDVRYSERPETLKEIGRYKLLILPFSYSMPKATFEAIRVAVEAGTKLLIYDLLAPTDEYGQNHPEPLLTSLVGHKNVTHVESDLMKDWSSRTVKGENLVLIRRLLNSANSFNPNGADVRYWARKLSDKEYLLYLGNMERLISAQPLVGLPLPQGDYSVMVCSSQEGTRENIALHSGLVGGKAAVGAGSLLSFNIGLSPGEIKLLRIQGK